MAYVTVPKDLTRVKSKIVFGLTKRQLICFGGALLVGVPLYFLLRGRVTGSAAALIMVFAASPLKWWYGRSSSAALSSPRKGPTKPTTPILPLCGSTKWKRR